MINAISGVTYSPTSMQQSNSFIHYFNEAIAAGYDPGEAKKWATNKVKEEREKKLKERKVKNSDKSKQQPKEGIDRRA